MNIETQGHCPAKFPTCFNTPACDPEDLDELVQVCLIGVEAKLCRKVGLQGCVRNAILSYYSYYFCSMQFVCTFSVCMKYPDDLLYLPESAKYNSSTLKSVQKLCSEWRTIIQLLLYCSMLCEYCE